MLRLGRTYAFSRIGPPCRTFSRTANIGTGIDDSTTAPLTTHYVPTQLRGWRSPVRHTLPQGELSRQAEDVRKRLDADQEHPIEVLGELLRGDGLPMDAFVLPLQIMSQRFQVLSREQQRQEVLEHPIAVEALQFLLHRPDLWPAFGREAHGTQGTLCAYAVIEGQDDFIKEWITATTTEVTGDRKAQFAWRGYLLRNLTLAYLTSEPDESADRALNYLMQVHQQRQAAIERSRHHRGWDRQSDALRCISFIPAAIAMQAALKSPYFPKTSSNVYDEFVQFYTDTFRKKDTGFQLDYSLAGLALRHPTRATPQPALELIDKYFSDDDKQALAAPLPTSASTRASLRTWMNMLYRFLNDAGRTADAKWVFDKQRRIFDDGQDERKKTVIRKTVRKDWYIP